MRPEREMAGTAQADRAKSDASGGPSGSSRSRRDRAVCRNPIRIELRPIDVREANEIERAVTMFARSANAVLIVTAASGSAIHADLIVSLAARHKLPAVYGNRHFVTGGGLISYGPDRVDQYRRAAAYVDRILKGEKPADMPVQAPTKFELVINLKTAKALGIAVPPALRASELVDRMRRREFITLASVAGSGAP